LARLIIAIILGLAIALGGAILVWNVVSGHGNSTPGDTSTYDYGTR
jgi:hypothetical protein